MKYSMWFWSIAMIAAATSVAAAQEKPADDPPADEPPARGRWAEGVRVPDDRLMNIVIARRARLGLNVNLRARESDSIGAFVEAVSPGGPADKAGIRSGDIITKLDGKPVVAGAASDADADESLPGLRLIELAAKLEPNDTVAVELRRGNQRQTVSLVTADEGGQVVVRGRRGDRSFGFRMGPGNDPMAGLGDLGGEFDRRPLRQFFFRSALGNLELAPLNPDLGQYFGTQGGVLVISVPPNSTLALKGGDVVLAVDGRKPANPSHLLRILRSYERGESFKLDIMRNRKRETVTGRLRDGRDGREEQGAESEPPTDEG